MPGTIYTGAPSSAGFGLGGQSYSNFLVSTVLQNREHYYDEGFLSSFEEKPWQWIKAYILIHLYIHVYIYI